MGRNRWFPYNEETSNMAEDSGIISEEKEYEEEPKTPLLPGWREYTETCGGGSANFPGGPRLLPSTGSCDMEVIDYQEEITSKRSTSPDELTVEVVREWG